MNKKAALIHRSAMYSFLTLPLEKMDNNLSENTAGCVWSMYWQTVK